MSLTVIINITVRVHVYNISKGALWIFLFLRKISDKEKGVFISEENWFSLLEKVSA